MKHHSPIERATLFYALCACYGAMGCAGKTDSSAADSALVAPPSSPDDVVSTEQEHLSLDRCHRAGDVAPSFGCNAASTCVVFGYGFEPESEWGGKCLDNDDVEGAISRLAVEAGCEMPYGPEPGYWPRMVLCND